MASFIAKFGFAGYGLFWAILEAIFLAPDHRLNLPPEEIPAFCESLGTNPKSFGAVLSYLEEKAYIRRSGDTIWSALHEADEVRSKKNQERHYERLLKKIAESLPPVSTEET